MFAFSLRSPPFLPPSPPSILETDVALVQLVINLSFLQAPKKGGQAYGQQVLALSVGTPVGWLEGTVSN